MKSCKYITHLIPTIREVERKWRNLLNALTEESRQWLNVYTYFRRKEQMLWCLAHEGTKTSIYGREIGSDRIELWWSTPKAVMMELGIPSDYPCRAFRLLNFLNSSQSLKGPNGLCNILKNKKVLFLVYYYILMFFIGRFHFISSYI